MNRNHVIEALRAADWSNTTIGNREVHDRASSILALLAAAPAQGGSTDE